MDPALAERARRYRMRAEELRTAAESMTNPVSRKTLLDLASSYDVLADGTEARATRIRGSKKPTG